MRALLIIILVFNAPAIRSFPLELHLIGFNFCGMGTKLTTRLIRGDFPANALDRACFYHDMSYHLYKDIFRRTEADKTLARESIKIVFNKNSSWWEKFNGFLVYLSMKFKIVNFHLRHRRPY
jgi:hypothetical protein